MHSRRSIKIRMDLYGLCASTFSTCVYAQARHLWQERAQPRTISHHCDTPTYACLRFVSAIVIAAISAAQRNIYGKRPKSYEFVRLSFQTSYAFIESLRHRCRHHCLLHKHATYGNARIEHATHKFVHSVNTCLKIIRHLSHRRQRRYLFCTIAAFMPITRSAPY